MNFKIRFYKKNEDTGCNYSKHFQEHWIANDKLHPAVKEIPVATYPGDYRDAHVIVEHNGLDIITMVGNQINPASLQEQLLVLLAQEKLHNE